MNMVERVARALFSQETRAMTGWTWEKEGATPELRTYWLNSARSAIAAMRDPTEAMVRAAHDADGNWGEAETHADTWRTMIDYILVAENAD